ncbi:hypothetical protein ACFFJT_20520 [Dyella flava]|uniref:Beta-barrel assembly machine subunit BamE n=1 Tax=Dyella flava TaxID=1920170 RepID=A0ABS2K0B7_9GAMM|nr:hypothetical protein [Dyella flava]MBM7124695.1 hypothetical protein [Dyella flava]GLQ49349.1 hypothetical protein GCM10010872_07980 [Dyella flava]
MRAVVRVALIVTLVLNLAGCYDVIKTPEIATASVYGPGISGGSLSPGEVAQLSSWLRAHDAGWRPLMETAPAPITLAIAIRGPTGRQSFLQLFEAKDGTAMAYLKEPIPARTLQRYVSAPDVAALRAAVGH